MGAEMLAGHEPGRARGRDRRDAANGPIPDRPLPHRPLANVPLPEVVSSSPPVLTVGIESRRRSKKNNRTRVRQPRRQWEVY